jgi:adenine-specific DNA-methyltransferase
VIDEAHEVFAGIYKRFDKFGQYNDEAPQGRTAGRVREVLLARGGTPVLLLTATPMQNNLAELWGLIQFVDPLGTLVGDLSTFRDVFCAGDDRHLMRGQEDELRNRLRKVVQRTLRRQAQDFLEKPFVNRQAKLFEYAMSPAEKSLYDDVTRYLLEPGIVAFQGRHRTLLLLGFHRRMASSTRALAASLQRVATRLRRKLTSDETDETEREDAASVVADLEDEDSEVEGASTIGPSESDAARSAHSPETIRAELRRVEGFINRAEGLGADDSKFRALLQALNFVTARAQEGLGAGKLVIFTESLVTQDYLRERLLESRFITDSDITVFRGTNDSKRAHEALERWLREVPQDEGRASSDDIAARLALVHEFKTRSKVFISTEAGAKGLNLQFCDTLVNYDLPWNPQRIEQRIGRCHRYGQQHDVTVINFLAKDNEAQALTFEILSQKLDLFGTVLDASDQVLNGADGPGGALLASTLGTEFESALRRVYERARTLEEVTAELRALRDKVAEERSRFEEAHTRTASLIDERFDDVVQSVFRGHQKDVPAALAELDRDLASVVLSYLDATAIPYERASLADVQLLHVAPSPALPENLRNGITAAIGASKEHTSLHLKHPLVIAAVAAARAPGPAMSAIVTLPPDSSVALRTCAAKRGRLRVVKVSFNGFEQVELLVTVVVLQGGDVLAPALSDALLRSQFRDSALPVNHQVSDDVLQDATDEILFSVQSSVDAAEHTRFERAQQQADRFVEDRLLVLKKRNRTLVERLEQARLRRDGAAGSEARTEAERALVSAQVALDEVEGAIGRLERHDDATLRAFQEHIHQRRYAPPHIEHLFDVDLVIE